METITCATCGYVCESTETTCVRCGRRFAWGAPPAPPTAEGVVVPYDQPTVQPRPLPPPVRNDPRLEGVGGWLRVFVVVLMVISPLVVVFNTAYVWKDGSPLAIARFSPPLFGLLIGELVLSFGLAMMGMWVGRTLAVREPGADVMAKHYLALVFACGLLDTLVGVTLPVHKLVHDAIVTSAIGHLLYALTSFALWTAYLAGSKRVAATYPKIVINGTRR